MLGSCWALFRLKWVLVRRGLSKQPLVGYFLLLVLFAVGALLSALCAVGLYGLGGYVGEKQSVLALLLLFDGIIAMYCFFYAWGVLMELQRTDLIDFRKMLMLPISLPAVYLMNFAVSLAGPLLFFSIPALVGLFLGLYPHYGPRLFLAGLPLALSFVLMLGAWAYYLRGRLAILIENPRKRRVIFMLLPVGFIFLGQLPAVIMHAAATAGPGRGSGMLLVTLEPYILLTNQSLPLLWPAYGLWTTLTYGGLYPLLPCMAGLWLATLLGLRLGYISTLRHYMGMYETARQQEVRAGAGKRRMPVTGRRLPLLGGDTAALVFGFYKSYSRHPHVRMLLIMPVCFGLFVLVMHRSGAYGETLGHEETWIPMAGLLWPFFNFSFFMFNIFGIDAVSFQALQLLPTPRYKYLLAKNLALTPIVLGLVAFFVTVSAFLTQASGRTLLLSFILAVHLFLLFSAVGNVISVKFPHRLHRDALRMPARRMRMIITGLASSLLSAILIMPSTLCMLLDRFHPVFLKGPFAPYSAIAAALALASLTALAYWRGLIHAGDMLTSDETRIYLKLSGDRE